MAHHIAIESLREPLLKCLDETFSNVHGIYLDKNTTLFQTLDSISSVEASEKISSNSATIAAQVEHVRFYLDVLDDYMRTNESKKVNWREIWETIGPVTEAQWTEAKSRLRSSHAKVISTINTFEKWDGEHDIGGALAILTHTAYHLGGIRTTLGAIRGRTNKH